MLQMLLQKRLFVERFAKILQMLLQKTLFVTCFAASSIVFWLLIVDISRQIDTHLTFFAAYMQLILLAFTV